MFYWFQLRSVSWLAPLLSCIAFLQCSFPSSDTLYIAIAANVQDAFTRQTNIPSEIILGSSGKLTAQIQQGSPLKLFSATQISGKYKATGTVLQILPNETTCIISIWVGNPIVKVLATEEIADIQEEDKVMVVSKAFNPLIMKIQPGQS